MRTDQKKLLWGLVALLSVILLALCLWLLLRSGSDPRDFDALREQNPDVYAWLEVPGTVVDYPILQNPDDDIYYLTRDLDGQDSGVGALFTQCGYNLKDFSDPVTIIYGNNLANGTMFGSLQSYGQSLTLDENAVFYIYLPERTLTYRIFAAVPHDNSHILYYNNFWDEAAHASFFNKVYETRSLHANLDPTASPNPDDHVVILSTHLQGDDSQRFLVMGVLMEDTNPTVS